MIDIYAIHSLEEKSICIEISLNNWFPSSYYEFDGSKISSLSFADLRRELTCMITDFFNPDHIFFRKKGVEHYHKNSLVLLEQLPNSAIDDLEVLLYKIKSTLHITHPELFI